MKNTIFTFLATLLLTVGSFANTKPNENKKTVQKENVTTEKIVVNSEPTVKEDDFCKITCSITENGVTYTATSGDWLTSCNKAGNDCLIKLGNLTHNNGN